MSYLSDLTAIRDGLATELKTFLELDDRNITHSVDGRTFDFNAYRTHLLKLVADANQMVINATGPVEIRTQILS